jgi:O-antigen ligase
LGQVNLESYNTFGLFCAIGLMNWAIYLASGGRAWLGVAGVAVCGGGALASKTLSVLLALALVAPVFILHVTAGRRVWRLAGLGLWIGGLIASGIIVRSELDLLGLRSRDTDTASGRLLIWDRVLNLLTSEPMGVSWSEYAAGAPIEQRYVDLRGEEYAPVISPHNIILTAFTFSGVQGGAMFLWLIGLWAKRLVSRLFKIKRGSTVSCVALLALLAYMTMDCWYFYFFFGIMWLYFDPASPSKGRAATT